MEVSERHYASRMLTRLVILFTLMNHSLQSCTSVQAPFPKLFGGPSQNSYFDTLDYNAYSEYLVGVGSTMDQAISSSVFSPVEFRPIIIAYDSSFDYKWGKVFYTGEVFFAVKINRRGTKVVASSKYPSRYLIVLDLTNGNILSTIQITTIDFENKFLRKLLLLDSGHILLGDEKNLYKIDPSNLGIARKYTTSTDYRTIGLQTSRYQVFLHIFSFNPSYNRCLFTLMDTDSMSLRHQKEVQCTLTGAFENFQVAYFMERSSGTIVDIIAFQEGTKFFKIRNIYSSSPTHTSSMVEDTTNPALVARGLLCVNSKLFYSLMYGAYASDANKIFIAEVNFQTNIIKYRRYLQAMGNIWLGIIYDVDKFFIVSHTNTIQQTSTTTFLLQNGVGHGIIYSPVMSCQDIDDTLSGSATLTPNTLVFTIVNIPFSVASFSASLASNPSVSMTETVFEGRYSSECSIIAASGSNDYQNLASDQISTIEYFVVEEGTKFIAIVPFTAEKIISATSVDPSFTYSLKSFAGTPNAVTVHPSTGKITIDTALFGVGEYNVVVEGKLQDCQKKRATFTLICEDNVAPEFFGVSGYILPSILIAQEDIQVSSFPVVIDPNPGQIITLILIIAPTFVQFTDTLHTAIMLEPTLTDPPGLYTLTLDLNDGFATTTYTLDIQVTLSPALQSPRLIINQGPPSFSSALEKINLKQGDVSQYMLPTIIDPDGDQVNMKIEMGEAVMFTDFTNGKFIFSIQNANNGGRYKIKIELADNNASPQTNFYYLEVEIKCVISSTQQLKIANQTLISLKLLKPTRNGQVRLHFTGAPYYSLPSLASELNEIQFLLTLNGLSPLNFTVIYDKQIVSQSGYIILQIQFENSASISLYDDPLDFIQIQAREDIIIQSTSCNFSIPKSTLSSVDLPNQQSPSSIELIQRMSDIASSVQIAMIPSSILINFFIQAAISKIWDMLNDISFMMNLPLIAIVLPGIASSVMSLILQFIYLDLLQTDKWLTPKEDEGQGLNNYFEQQGFKSVNILFNLGSTLIYTFALIGLYLVFLLSVCFFKRLALYLDKRLFWGTTIRFQFNNSSQCQYLHLLTHNTWNSQA
ncbi:hypothetical protein FGO68_gene8493 [Halteria grandinella]|uniref:Uncharacterized protein n=1 Tax=Halteria grandinella TaxID=5974 RepID=A0A8J8T875_HALGN|nr:hypothetical protein FGO68_gene8493 [Halteria grandinella]